jgi:NAD(P)-dependent dehydrogenase (short-subunit alcohol dehydrogenase family)/acyl carrier protein
LKQGGVYLITGGLGGIGLELADYLGKTVQAKLILLGRTKLPPQEAWANWVAAHAADDPTSRKIARLQRIQSYGAEVFLCSAEVSDREQLRSAVRGARDRFGRIDGVIHAAGVMGGGTIRLKTRDEAMAVLQAKVRGTRVLAEVLSEQPPDFLILCSSVNAVVGGFGQVDYCAANAFLDAFAHSHQARTGMATLSVDWDMWSEVGLAQNTNVPEHLQQQRSMEISLGITALEGLEVFSRLLGCALPQILVSTREFTEMRASRQSVGQLSDQSATAPQAARAAGHPRPELTNSYVAPADDVERTVAGIWQQALGIDKVGVSDNFFELGGDSLLAVQVVGQMRQAMKISFPVAAFYADPTIASLKKHLLGDAKAAPERSVTDGRREARQGLGMRAKRLRKVEAGRDT